MQEATFTNRDIKSGENLEAKVAHFGLGKDPVKGTLNTVRGDEERLQSEANAIDYLRHGQCFEEVKSVHGRWESACKDDMAKRGSHYVDCFSVANALIRARYCIDRSASCCEEVTDELEQDSIMYHVAEKTIIRAAYIRCVSICSIGGNFRGCKRGRNPSGVDSSESARFQLYQQFFLLQS
ncbi:hypothetical protein SELMODRAFT_412080 [Selaginella moellendorffii]|uniref:Uncharacterized protein n=1 Tax=Selaginella moellendorffii TaxID=88036 RepID=D8RJZ8_SELML|nr:hypothetical protein SELMODRAFT_412080 [Selaginella moellendorffii]